MLTGTVRRAIMALALLLLSATPAALPAQAPNPEAQLR